MCEMCGGPQTWWVQETPLQHAGDLVIAKHPGLAQIRLQLNITGELIGNGNGLVVYIHLIRISLKSSTQWLYGNISEKVNVDGSLTGCSIAYTIGTK